MMLGTPEADLAGLVMAGVFEPIGCRFSEGFARTGLAAPLAPIGPIALSSACLSGPAAGLQDQGRVADKFIISPAVEQSISL